MTHYLLGGMTGVAYPESNDSAREHGKPVVVIDPEDPEAVDRLVGVLSKTYAKAGLQFLSMGQMFHEERSGTFADALREFANPKSPKPEEPTGLGAVVEDARGGRFIRDGFSNCDPNWRRASFSEWVWYSDIDAVKVLSEGVPE
jgi:hypothetical protein